MAFGCADGTTGSALAEWRRLVEQAGADVVIGPLSGDEGLALPEYARRQPGIAFVNGSSSSQQLRPARNTYSFWYDGAQWMAGVGAYAYKKLGWRTAVTIGGADTFDWAQVAGFDAEFCALGGTIVKRLWVPQEAQDFAGLVAQVPRSGVDGFLVEAQGPGPLLTLARDYPGLRGNLGRKVVGGTTLVPPHKLGARVRGIVWGGPTHDPDPAYLPTLRKAFPEIAKDYLGFAFDYAYYDAMTATLQALDRVHGDLSDGEKRFMAALAHVELDAPNGRTTLDASHRAIAPNTLFETLTASTSRVLRTIPAVDASFGGYFKPSGPAAGQDDSGLREADPAAVGALIAPERPGEAGQVLRRREAPRPQSLAHEQRRVAATGERGPSRAETLLVPAVGQADDRHRRVRGSGDERIRARLDQERLGGHAQRTLNSEGGAGQQSARVPAALHRRPGEAERHLPAPRRARRRARSRSSRGRCRRRGRAPAPRPRIAAGEHGDVARRGTEQIGQIGVLEQRRRSGDEHEVDVLLGRQPCGVRCRASRS